VADGSGRPALGSESVERSSERGADAWVADSGLGEKGKSNAETQRARGSRREQRAAQSDCIVTRFLRAERDEIARWNW
jgi:hypothetical protein